MTAPSVRRRRARRLIIIGVLLIMLGVLAALSFSVLPASQGAEPGDEPQDLTLIVVALIGAIPGTITAVTGLVLALRASSPAKPTSTTPSGSDQPASNQ